MSIYGAGGPTVSGIDRTYGGSGVGTPEIAIADAPADGVIYVRLNQDWKAITTVASEIDHGGLGGLGDDDHPHYLLADGTRALTADWNAGAYTITSAGVIAGDAGFESASLTINGGTYGAALKTSDIANTNLATQHIHKHSTTLPGTLVFTRSHTDDSSHAIVQNGDILAYIVGAGHDGTDYAIGATIAFVVSGTPGNNDMPTKISMAVSPDGSHTPVEQFKIEPNGTVTAITAFTTPSLTATTATITGGSITGITDLAVADGGTGASTASGARTNLGLVIGTDVQAYDAGLASIAGLTTAADKLIYTTASDVYAVTSFTAFARTLIDDADAATARSTLGLGTIATQSAASVAITGGSITGITDLAIADGGTGGSTEQAALNNLINGLTAQTSPGIDDYLAIRDTGLLTARKVLVSDFFKVINGLSADATPDASADYLVTYDTSASAAKKVLLSKVGGGARVSVAQTAHGFTVGDVLYHNGTIYAKAKADATATAEVAGIVSEVTDANNFVLTAGGEVTGLSGLTAGTVYFLSPTTAGALTSTEPNTAGQVSKPLLVATGTTSGLFMNMRGLVVSDATYSIWNRVSGTATAGQTSITGCAYTAPLLQVLVNGVTLPPSDYTATDGSTVTLGTGMTSGDSYEVIGWTVQTVLPGMPTATVTPYAGATAPSGWLLCDGSAVSRTTYAALFAIISTTYGVGDGSTTFNLPDLGGRVVAGKEATASRLTSGVSGVDGATLGASGGNQNRPQHNHGVTDPTHGHGTTEPPHGHSVSGTLYATASGTANGSPVGGGTGGSFAGATPLGADANTTGVSVNNASTGVTVNNDGSGTSQNVQPTMVLNYIIKT